MDYTVYEHWNRQLTDFLSQYLKFDKTILRDGMAPEKFFYKAIKLLLDKKVFTSQDDFNKEISKTHKIIVPERYFKGVQQC